MRLPIEKLTVAQMRHLMKKLGKCPKGMSKRSLIVTLNALIGQDSL